MNIVALVLLLILFSPNAFAETGIISTYVGPGLPVNGASAATQNIDWPASVAADGAGGFYFANSQNRVYRVRSDGNIYLVAGTGAFGFSGDGGKATEAELAGPHGIAVDSAGNLYIADTYSQRIRKVTTAGVISTIAGTGTSGFSGDDGKATAAKLSSPFGLAIDPAGNLYIADAGNQRVRKVTPAGVITTVAGNGTAGYSGDGELATMAKLYYPYGVAVDPSGNIYVADTGNHRVRKIDSTQTITTFAGTGAYGFGGDGNAAVSAKLYFPYDVAADPSGNIYIADYGNFRIRKVTVAGVISTFAGNGNQGFEGDGGQATGASLDGIRSVAADSSAVYIADSDNHRIRKVSGGTIQTVAGSSGFSGDGGYAANAVISDPSGLVVDSSGTLYFADTYNHRIRKVTAAGIISTIAGKGDNGFSGDGGQATSAKLNAPTDVAVDSSQNIYVADFLNHRIRKISPAGVISTVAGTGAYGFSGDGGQATAAQLYYPHGIAVDSTGNLYIADSTNNRIRKVSPGGIISTVAGTGSAGFSGDGGDAKAAQLYGPYGVAVDSSGNLYIADTGNNRIRKVASDGTISTVAGTGSASYSGDGGAATSAGMNLPYGVSLDASGNLYIADVKNNAVRKVTASSSVISTLAGNGSPGFSGDGGPAREAQLDSPNAVALDPSGNVYIADSGNRRVRKISYSSASETYFPQVAIGGGWATSFTISNTSSTTISGTLSLLTQDGNPLLVSTNLGSGASFPISLPPGGTLFVSANPLNSSDPTKSGWAKVTTTGGSLTGVATYQYFSDQTLQTAIGVLSTAPSTNATIPMDDNESQSVATAYAVGNPTFRDLVIKLCLVDKDGNVVDDTVMKTLAPGQQISGYVNQDFKRATFQGSVVMRAQGGGSFVAVGLIQRQSVFTVVPVIPGKAGTIPE